MSETRRDLDRVGGQRVRRQTPTRRHRARRPLRRHTSVTVCAFTTDPTDAPLFRLLVEADETTGIRESSRLMVDKFTTIPRSKLGERVRQLSDDDLIRLSRALVVFLGLAGT